MALPFASVSTAATLAPRIEIYTILACSVHKPEYTMYLKLSKQLGLPYIEDASDLLVSNALFGSVASPLMPVNVASEGNIAHIYFADLPDASNGTDSGDKSLNRCASDPEVQAAVAKLTAGELPIQYSTIVPGFSRCIAISYQRPTKCLYIKLCST